MLHAVPQPGGFDELCAFPFFSDQAGLRYGSHVVVVVVHHQSMYVGELRDMPHHRIFLDGYSAAPRNFQVDLPEHRFIGADNGPEIADDPFCFGKCAQYHDFFRPGCTQQGSAQNGRAAAQRMADNGVHIPFLFQEFFYDSAENQQVEHAPAGKAAGRRVERPNGKTHLPQGLHVLPPPGGIGFPAVQKQHTAAVGHAGGLPAKVGDGRAVHVHNRLSRRQQKILVLLVHRFPPRTAKQPKRDTPRHSRRHPGQQVEALTDTAKFFEGRFGEVGHFVVSYRLLVIRGGRGQSAPKIGCKIGCQARGI